MTSPALLRAPSGTAEPSVLPAAELPRFGGSLCPTSTEFAPPASPFAFLRRPLSLLTGSQHAESRPPVPPGLKS